MPKKKATTHKLTWRDYSDANHRSFTSRPDPESLHPNASTIERAIGGNPEARAVTDSYAFRMPVIFMTREELELA